MTKAVWIFRDEQFNCEEDAREAVGKSAAEDIQYETSDFVEWFTYTYDGCEFGWNYCFDAYDVAEAMEVDFDDFLEDYADHVYDSEVEEEEVEVEVDYIFNGEKYDTREEAELAVIDYANGGAYRDNIDSDGEVEIYVMGDECGTMVSRRFARSEILFKMDESAYWDGFALFCDMLKRTIVEVEREVDDEGEGDDDYE